MGSEMCIRDSDATADLADMILVNDGSIDELNADLEELWTMLSD